MVQVHHTPRQRPAMTTQQRAALMMDLEQSAWTWGGSWSRFPSHVMGGGDQSLALRVLQRSVRQWLARRWRVKEHRRREAAAFIVQRFFLDLLPKFERLRQQSARIIQRVFRGHRARIVCRFALRCVCWGAMCAVFVVQRVCWCLLLRSCMSVV